MIGVQSDTSERNEEVKSTINPRCGTNLSCGRSSRHHDGRHQGKKSSGWAARVIACTGLQGRLTDFVDHWEFQHVYDDATHTVLSSVGAIIAYTFRWIRDMY